MADPLADLWAATEAPARDLEFELAVEVAVTRRRLLRQAMLWSGGTAAAGVAFWGAWPGLAPVLDVAASTFVAALPVVAMAGAAAGLALWLSQRLAFDAR
jgi:hypothetical protein